MSTEYKTTRKSQSKKLQKSIRKKVLIIRCLNVLAFLLHAGSFIAGLIVVLVTDKTLQLVTSTDFVKVVDIEVSPGNTKSFFEIDLSETKYNPIYLVLAIPAITSLFHFFIGVVLPLISTDYSSLRKTANVVDYIYKLFHANVGRYVTFYASPTTGTKLLTWFDYYANTVTFGINPLRWIEYSITSSLMLFVICTLSTVTNVFLLVSVVVLNLVLMWVGGNYFEQVNKGTVFPLSAKNAPRRYKLIWNPYLLGCLVYIWQWIIIFFYFFTAVVEASDEVPIYAYLVVIGIFANFSLFAVNALLHYMRAFSWISSSSNYEIVYIILSFISKFYLDWVLIIGIALTPREIEFK